MTGCVKNGILLVFCVEVGATDLNSLTLGLLLITDVHDVSKPPRVTTLILGLCLVLFNCPLINNSIHKHQVTTNGRLA